MKYILTVALVFLQVCLEAQLTGVKPIIKTARIYTNKKLSSYEEYDRNGNVVYSKSNELIGPITTLTVTEYDSVNRETREYFAHSNLGFSLSERVYLPHKILHYEYNSDSAAGYPFDRETLNKINSPKEFLELPVIKELSIGKKVLTKTDSLDAAGNIVAEYYFSEKGDTTGINLHQYNKNNKEVFFHYGTLNSEKWTWDIYDIYNDSSKLVKSYRISSEQGIKDTSEVYIYTYNSSGQLVSHTSYYKGNFGNRSVFFYNEKNQLIKELFYEGNETELDVMTLFKYDKRGNYSEKASYDYRPFSKGQKIYKYKIQYW